MTMIFDDFDVSDFWGNDEVMEPIADEFISSVEKEIGYKLPQSYIELMRQRNGAIPTRIAHRVNEKTSWAPDHIMIEEIFGIKDLVEQSELWLGEWQYPPIGIYFAECPSGGHDMLCLDYRKCGPQGEPQVVHVDQEYDYKITFVAETFESFIRGLESEDAF